VLFGFRGIRAFQALLAMIALAMGAGCAIALKVFSDEGAIVALIVAVVFGIVFLWSFAAALRAPTSFVAVADERTRIRFAGFLDTVVANEDIVSVRLARHSLWGGIGIRTDFRGTVALATAFGTVAELEFREPLRVWAIPRIWRLRARRLRVSVRNPEKLVQRFAKPDSGGVKPGDEPRAQAAGRRRVRR
jgi:hypothetical protein